MKRLARAIVVLGLVCVATTTAQAEGGIGGRPASPNPDIPRSQSIFIHSLRPTQTTTDQLYVNNGSDRQRTISLYAVDGEVTNTGAYSCKQRAEEVKGSGAWIRLAESEITLEPNGHQIVEFSITVPDRADVGEHNACLVMQDKNDAGSAGSGVRLFTRQAVRVVTTIPGDLRREVSLGQFAFTATNQAQTYELAVSNTGNVSTDVEITVRLKDMFGREVYSNGGSSPVLSGTTLRQQYSDEKQLFWGGWYSAQATLRYDQRPTKYGLAADAQIVERQSGVITVFVMPTIWALVIIVAGIVVLIGLGVVILVRIRSRRRRSLKLGGSRR